MALQQRQVPGTITVTATNSEGTADWTVAYTIAAAIMPLFFATIADVTTRAQSGGVSFYTVAGRGDSTGAVTAGSLDYATGMDVDRIMKLASTQDALSMTLARATRSKPRFRRSLPPVWSSIYR